MPKEAGSILVLFHYEMPGTFRRGTSDSQSGFELKVFANPAFLLGDALDCQFADAIDVRGGADGKRKVGAVKQAVAHRRGIKEPVKVTHSSSGTQDGSVAPEIGVAIEEQEKGGKLVGGIAGPAGAGVAGDDGGALIKHQFQPGGIGEVFVNNRCAVFMAGVNHDDQLEFSTAAVKLRELAVSNIDSLGRGMDFEKPGPLTVYALQFFDSIFALRIYPGTGYHTVLVLCSDFEEIVIGDIETGAFPVGFAFGIVAGILAHEGDAGQARTLYLICQDIDIAFVESVTTGANIQGNGEGTELDAVLYDVTDPAA